MKKLLLKLTIFSSLIFFIEYEISNLIREGKFNINIINSGIFILQEKSKQQHIAPRLIIGDSVCDQLYSGNLDNSALCSLASNQGVTIAGYYMLIYNYLQKNKPKEIYLLVHPSTLQNNLSKVSYNYFLKPFYNKEYKHLINETLHKEIKQIPNYWMCQLPIFFSTSYTPIYETSKTNPISNISKAYIDSISNICNKNNIKFQLVIPPVSDIYKKEFSLIKEKLHEEPYTSAFSKIEFIPDSLFIDHTHFKHKYIPNDYLKLYE